MRTSLLLNEGWLFKKGDLPNDEIYGHYATYMISKAQNAQGAGKHDYYDKNFEEVRLPHDYVLTGVPSSEYNASQGSYLRENAWYRRHFILPEGCEDKRVVLYFEGAGQNTTVWLNGHFAGENSSLYNSFTIDITPYLEFDEAVNTIAVRIENPKVEGWWYEGAGLYRNVHMIITEKLSVDPMGIWVNPTHLGNDVWNVPVETTLFSLFDDVQEVSLRHTIRDAGGAVVATGDFTSNALPVTSVSTHCLRVECPLRWSVDCPTLYTLETEVLLGDACLDCVSTQFGFRTLTFDPKTGFYLNDQSLKLRGACIHQDFGTLGVAVPDDIIEYRVRKFKECGMNALRLAHHNHAPAIYEICNRLGMLLIDENRWFNCSASSQREIVSMLKRDRNNPSVIIWSVGNEEPLQNTLVGQRITNEIKRLVKRYDTTRPVTVALNGGFFDSFVAKASDIVAPNYYLEGYDQYPIVHPEKFILTTESGASSSDRGVYFDTDPTKFFSEFSTAYDLQRAVFGSSYRDAIREAELRPFIGGTFLWAGNDYRGEADWPKLFSASSIMDACMMEKDNFYQCVSFWTQEPMVHILPHWTFPEKAGDDIEVFVYTNQPEAELFLNGNSLGKKVCEKFAPPSWMVPYEEGTLEAITYNNGTRSVSTAHHTAGAPKTLCISQTSLCPNNSGEQTVVAVVCLRDEKGNICPTATDRVVFACDDGGEILGVCNGNTMDHEDPRRLDKKLHAGLCQVVARVKEGATSLTITARATDLALSDQICVIPTQVAAPARLAKCDSSLQVTAFRIWSNSNTLDAVNATYELFDMNSSVPVNMPINRMKESEDYTVLTARNVIPLCTETLCVKLLHVTGKGRLRLTHEAVVHANEVTEQGFDKTIDFDCNDETIVIPLHKYSSTKKMDFVIALDNRVPFAVKDVIFDL